ncbi:hypothetical protein UlMin_040917 [Ulmus minor]
MFPCSSIYQQPFSRTNQTTRLENPSSDELEQKNSSHSHYFPTILEEDGLLLSHLLSQQQFLDGSTSHQPPNTDEISGVASNKEDIENLSKGLVKKRGKSSTSGAKQKVPRRRTGKKDRHSKISTAQGLRDRRMRLSLQIARRFFGLQDMLGFDKASRTIEWLFLKSKSAIKELTQSLKKHNAHSINGWSSSTSESEVVSRTMEAPDQTQGQMGSGRKEEGEFFAVKEKKNRKLHIVARESRDKARARARERTREKMMEKTRQISSDEANTKDLGKLPRLSCSSKMGDQDKSKEPANQFLEHVDSLSFDEKFLAITSEPRSSFLPNYYSSHHVGVSSGANSEDDFLGFPGNWEMINSSITQSFCCTIRNMKQAVIGNVQEQNPCTIFSSNLDSGIQEEKPISIFPNPQVQNPSSIFMNPSQTYEENPRSVYMGEEQNPNPIFITALIEPNSFATSRISFPFSY